MKNKFTEPNMNFVPSSIHNGKKLRAIANKVYSTPINETFHQFLEEFILKKFGDDWFLQQEKTSKKDQSSLFLWADNYLREIIKNKQKNPNQKILSIPNTGSHRACMSFAYELLCLEQKFSLPQELIKRLKTNKYFQSAKYELAIGAIFVRAGFNIKWIAPSHLKKSCEFTAIHRETGHNFRVEVKSKRRPGILNEKGEKEPIPKEITRLLKKALTKTSEAGNLIIFIDLNLDPKIGQQILLNETNKALGKVIKPSSEENPDLFSLIAFTNFPFHYDASKINYAFAKPPNPKQSMPIKVQEDIEKSLFNYGRYGRIPEEI